MQIQQLPLEAIIPYARNPRKNAGAVDKVANSIQAFGFKQPIVVDGEKVIIVGHTRYLAAKQLGMNHVPVLIAEDLTPEQAKAYRLADNRSHEESTWDRDLLALELGDLSRLHFDVSLTAFDAEEMAGLMAMAESVEKGLTEDDACEDVPEQQPIAKPGELWQLGRHVVMCGDSTCLEQVQLLMGDQRADMVFTDPPYNVNYQGCRGDRSPIAQDNLSTTQFVTFLQAVFAHCAKVIKKTASLYVFHSWTYQREFQDALEANGFRVRQQIIWAKHHFSQNFGGRYKFQHEAIFYCHVQAENDAWYGNNGQSTLWPFDKPGISRLHPTMKPVALIEKALMNSSQAGEIVLDLFGGSGSTLIACEKTGRTARLMEIDPKYVDVIVNRWEAFTGQKAMLLDGACTSNTNP
jgi:DNA modification methylase